MVINPPLMYPFGFGTVVDLSTPTVYVAITVRSVGWVFVVGAFLLTFRFVMPRIPQLALLVFIIDGRDKPLRHVKPSSTIP
jgi:hypothetical protein